MRATAAEPATLSTECCSVAGMVRRSATTIKPGPSMPRRAIVTVARTLDTLELYGQRSLSLGGRRQRQRSLRTAAGDRR
jgi:hypothetical protein